MLYPLPSLLPPTRVQTPRTFEFLIPEGSNLKFSPKVESVPAKSSLRVQVDYSPVAGKATSSARIFN